MTTPTDTTLAASTSQYTSEALFHDVPPQRAAVIEYELDNDTVSLDSGADTPPPHVGPSSSSLKMPMPDADHASGSKRKQEDRDEAYDAEAQTLDRKKPKQEDSPDERIYSSLITPRHMSDEVARVEGLVNVCHAIASCITH